LEGIEYCIHHDSIQGMLDKLHRVYRTLGPSLDNVAAISGDPRLKHFEASCFCFTAVPSCVGLGPWGTYSTCRAILVDLSKPHLRRLTFGSVTMPSRGRFEPSVCHLGVVSGGFGASASMLSCYVLASVCALRLCDCGLA
jgi:hypothetical protein